MSNQPKITAEIFEKATGRKPENDDLDRCNCPDVGQIGHHMCGWDEEANLPWFMSPNVSTRFSTSVRKNEDFR